MGTINKDANIYRSIKGRYTLTENAPIRTKVREQPPMSRKYPGFKLA